MYDDATGSYVSCPDFTYSLGGAQQGCAACPGNFTCVAGNLSLNAGFWRARRGDLHYYACSREEDVCLAHDSCRRGNKGALCAECDAALHLQRTNSFGACAVCAAPSSHEARAAVKFCFHVVFVLVLFALFRREYAQHLEQRTLFRVFGVFVALDHRSLLALAGVLSFVQTLVIPTQTPSFWPQRLLNELQDLLSPGYVSFDVLCQLSDNDSPEKYLSAYRLNIGVFGAQLGALLIFQQCLRFFEKSRELARATIYEAVCKKKQKFVEASYTLGLSAMRALDAYVLVQFLVDLWMFGLLNQGIALISTQEIAGATGSL